MKKRLAIFVHGGISGGNASQGVPMIVQIVTRLSDNFEITVYSLSSVDGSNEKYRIYSPSILIKNKLLRWMNFISLFIRHHKHDPYDCLYSFWGYPMGFVVVVLGKIFRKRSYVNLLGAETANIPSISYGHLRNVFSRKIVLWTCNHAYCVITVSQSQVNILKAYRVTRDLKLIPWGSDKALFYPRKTSRSSLLKLIHVANITEVKDQTTLINFFELIVKSIPAKLKIVGSDYMGGKIQKLVADKGLSNDVEFVGHVKHASLVDYLHWADAFVLTSLSEGQNNSITEAMMCGLLPVSTDVGIMEKSFGDKVGIVGSVGDYPYLADELLRHYHDEVLWNSKVENAISWTLAHDLDWTITELTSLLRDED